MTNAHAMVFVSMNTLCVPCLLGNRWDDSHQTRNENGSSVTNAHAMIFISMNDHQTPLSSSGLGVLQNTPTGLKDASQNSS